MIHTLSLHLISSRDLTANSYTAFDLSSFSSLQTLRLDIPVGHAQFVLLDYERLVWRYISNILSTTSHLPLQDVTLVLQFNGKTTMQDLLDNSPTSMVRIDHVLSRIPTLRKFKLLQRGAGPSEEELKMVGEMFEGLKERGVLDYRLADDEAEVEHLIEIIPGLQATLW